MPQAAPASIVVPTFQEASNLAPLTERIAAAMASTGISYEILIVDDDSRDGTDEVVAYLAQKYPIRLITRKGVRGLSSAVLEGFRSAAFERFVVMDADLQHPPESIPALLACLNDPTTDFAIASRYGPAGGLSAKWPMSRRIGSRVATLLARPLVKLSDPMSGFFALRKHVWEETSRRVDPIGYKIALELVVKSGCQNVIEVPITFAIRRAGESKAGVGVMMRFLQHLWRLYCFRFPRTPWIAAGASLVLIIVAAAVVWAVV
jgi:dolichol-phosphate mannosyltransferase